MAKYRITKDTHLRLGNDPRVQLVKAGTEIEYAGIPGSTWVALDAEAEAMLMQHCPFEFLPNGLQVRRRSTGELRISQMSGRTTQMVG